MMKQRDMMRQLFERCRGDRVRIVSAYAEAERRGRVSRMRNRYGLSAEDYAARLLADGLRKTWLRDA